MLSAEQRFIVEAMKTHRHTLKVAIWSYLRSLISSQRGAIESEWEDVFADVRERALRNAHRYDPEKSIVGWLQSIALNCVRDLKRKKNHEVLASEVPLPQEDATKNRATAPSEADIFDLMQKFTTPARETDNMQLEDFLPYIAPAYHFILRLHLETGLVGQALALRLQISEGAASVKLCRAKAALLAAYKNYQDNTTQKGDSP